MTDSFIIETGNLERTSDNDFLHGDESRRLDHQFSGRFDPDTRRDIWASANRVLQKGPLEAKGVATATGLALGYVQSGKTTSITALIAQAADDGYQVIIAILGSTKLLLNQNRLRLEKSFELESRDDYRWVVEPNPAGITATKRIMDFVGRGRVILIPLLKHSGRISAAMECLATLPDETAVLIVDDEADQASLNTAGQDKESKTYESLRLLKNALPKHLYVQYTATPYAPLLLDAADILSPQFVEFLNPGTGYTGGREFFVDFSDQVVRNVPVLEEQATKTPPLSLPRSLKSALGSFIAGAALLLAHDVAEKPVSMLVHSTARNDVQARYLFLLERQLRGWRQKIQKAESFSDFPDEIQVEKEALIRGGIADIDEQRLMQSIRYTLKEVTFWLINSESALNKVDWNVAPVHILIGGNKLDRGFTVEGLTVTYMNRPASPQVDTLEQRARAFGYRRDQLPYCQFFASHKTIRSLRDTVFTEYDLRAQLRDHIDAGGSIHSWAREIGLLLPEGMKPTRNAVVKALSTQQFGWHSLRRPALDSDAIKGNYELVQNSGLLTAEFQNYGRLKFRTKFMALDDIIEQLFKPWIVESYSPSWRQGEILDALTRTPHRERPVPLVLLEDHGEARVRKWESETGFVNLFQGHDVRPQSDGTFYPGDRSIFNVDEDPHQLIVQVHRVKQRGPGGNAELMTLAIYLGTFSIVRKD